MLEENQMAYMTLSKNQNLMIELKDSESVLHTARKEPYLSVQGLIAENGKPSSMAKEGKPEAVSSAS